MKKVIMVLSLFMMIILLSSSVFADGFVADESNMGINDEESLSPRRTSGLCLLYQDMRISIKQ